MYDGRRNLCVPVSSGTESLSNVTGLHSNTARWHGRWRRRQSDGQFCHRISGANSYEWAGGDATATNLNSIDDHTTGRIRVDNASGQSESKSEWRNDAIECDANTKYGHIDGGVAAAERPMETIWNQHQLALRRDRWLRCLVSIRADCVWGRWAAALPLDH